jgi:hypothetical protein
MSTSLVAQGFHLKGDSICINQWCKVSGHETALPHGWQRSLHKALNHALKLEAVKAAAGPPAKRQAIRGGV